MDKNVNAPSELPEVFSKPFQLANLPQIKKGPFLPLYNICFVGHVDSGKSTTVSRILYDTGRISPHIIEQYAKEAKAIDKESFKFAWLMDKTEVERKRGITIDISVAEWSTKNRYFTIIDAPGHSDFMKNMITGTSQADLAVLLIDAQKGIVEGQNTQEHLFLCRATGISSLVIALNKVNLVPLESRKELIEERTKEAIELAVSCGYNPKNVIVVPVNSWDGWNIKDPAPEHLPGYNGPTLIDALDTVPMEPHNTGLPLRISIESTFKKIGGTNLVVAGKVLSGVLYPGQVLSVKPAGVNATVRSIQMHHKTLSYATPGANVGIDLKGVTNQQCTKASILSDSNEDTAKAVKEFSLENAIIRQHPTELVLGSNIIVHYQTGNVCCEVKRLYNVRNLTTKSYQEGDVTSVKPGSLVCMDLVPDRPIVVEPKEKHPKLCRVMLRDSNKTIGFGTVSKVVPSDFEA